ncbi:MAG TPA: 50S ribosomal protein L30 [Saprospiraceae bacterium]|nr:50S ribosomal protein L30 [Saprospiraceae bacterium]HND86926.1 50S ribosomal protein L30 [Saprospiraceae bacterium]
MDKIAVTLIKSPIDKPKRQKATLRSLGFTKVNQTIELVTSPQVNGMLKVVAHLVSIKSN